MMNSGAIISTVEAALLDMMYDSKKPEFKIMLGIVKNKLNIEDPLTDFL